MIIKNDYPILEYSTEKNAIINPDRNSGKLPRLCLVTFFEEVLSEFVKKYNGVIIATYVSEMKDFHVYKLKYNDMEICVVQAVVASGSIAQFRGKVFGQMLYSGDILVNADAYDERDWNNNTSAREKLFYLSLEALCML